MRQKDEESVDIVLGNNKKKELVQKTAKKNAFPNRSKEKRKEAVRN